MEGEIFSRISHSGEKALCVTKEKHFAKKTNLYTSRRDIDVYPETDYSLAAWFKTEGVKDKVGFVVEERDIRDKKINSIRSDRYLIGDNKWTRLKASFKTGPETVWLLVRIPRIYGFTKGKVYVDDIIFSQD